ncbi:hypothetical protein M409DRAFT_57336 [Zasmidium cellare ATCC 36951]|uniref:Uncharacterized protein n=1 Tax=Zasmidium cellare ATCC 36951 TaxID=1080233 RepID=A0A6A6CB17_ZASCE|nr:uncharacterized protein M409DRAFT_57336 [Zasmidium cellare ATCC 36951]KAF2163428.1 hypothetical protein M409DRAFT_57336 [Zasmidium cellare ATCC 36951]
MSTPPPTTPGKDTVKPAFSEKDMRLLAAAMLSLKTGLPELDYVKFQANGEFNTMKTAQNTWGVLKKKIMSMNPEAAEAAVGESFPVFPVSTYFVDCVVLTEDDIKATPKSKATPKKRTKKEAEAEDGDEGAGADDEEASAKKKPKTPRKKKADAAADEEGAGDDSPALAKKAPKTPRKKATPAKKSEETVKEEAKSDDGDGEASSSSAAAVGGAEEAKKEVAAEEPKTPEPAPAAEDVKMEGSGDE